MTNFRLLLALSLGLAAADASARTVAAPRVNAAPAPVALPRVTTPMGALGVMPLTPTSLTPSLSLTAPALAPSAPAETAPAAVAAPVALAVDAPAAVATPLAALEAAGVMAASALAPEASDASAKTVAGRSFDLNAARAGSDDLVVAPAAAKRGGLLRRASLAAAAVFAAPSVAFAAVPAAAAEPGALALVTLYAPLATVLSAVVGALFGLWSSRGADGAGSTLGSALSHGAIAGAAAFVLFDLAQMVFMGTSAGFLAPMTAAVTTAALAQNAFGARFTWPTTTPAERVMGAFPAVAMAFGLSVAATALLTPSILLTVATAMMMATGAAAALYTALFRLEKSPAEGPAAMGRGFVLQSLMVGLSLALGPTAYGYFFFALGVAGFGLVMRTTSAEVWAAVPQSLKDRFKR